MCNFQWKTICFSSFSQSIRLNTEKKKKMTAQLILNTNFSHSFRLSVSLFVRTPADHHLHLSHIIICSSYSIIKFVMCLHLCQFLTLCGFFLSLHLFICTFSAFTFVDLLHFQRIHSPNNTTQLTLLLAFFRTLFLIGLFYLT